MTRDTTGTSLRQDLSFRFCLMLAFQSMIANSSETKDAAKRIVELAKRMNEFCDLYVAEAFPSTTIAFTEDKGATKIDKTIERHIEELRNDGATRLPEDRETLIQFYDRLQQRKSRRMQWMFYAKATQEKLADLVLRYLDEEIEDAEELS